MPKENTFECRLWSPDHTLEGCQSWLHYANGHCNCWIIIGKKPSPWLSLFVPTQVGCWRLRKSPFCCCLLFPQQLCCQSDAVPSVNGAVTVSPPRWWRILSLIHLFYTGSENKTTVCAYTEAPGLTGTCRLTRHSASMLFSTRSNINKWMCSFGERRL